MGSMLPYIAAPWILWVWHICHQTESGHRMSFFRLGEAPATSWQARLSILFTGGYFCDLRVCSMYGVCMICNIYIMGLTMGCTSKIAIGIRKGCKRMINLGNLSLLDKSILYSLPHDHLKHVLVMYIGCPSCLPLCKAHLSFGQISVLSPFNIIQSCSIPQIVSK